jgi:hypothetical protein
VEQHLSSAKSRTLIKVDGSLAHMKRRARARKAAARRPKRKPVKRSPRKAIRKAIKRAPKRNRPVRSLSRKKPAKSARRSAKRASRIGAKKVPARKKSKKQSSHPSSGRRFSGRSNAAVKGEHISFEPLEQVVVSCVNCSREFTIVKLRGLSTDGLVCQRCSMGEMQFPE